MRRLFSKDAMTGVERWWHYDSDTDQATIETRHDITSIAEFAKRSMNAAPSKGARYRGEGFHHVGIIPAGLLGKLMAEGKLHDEDHMKRVMNDPESGFIKTMPGRI